MKSSIVKRSIVIDGHKTSVSLEDAFWNDVKNIARVRRGTISKLLGEIDRTRGHGNLSSAIRLFVLGHFLSKHNQIDAPATHHARVDGERARSLQP